MNDRSRESGMSILELLAAATIAAIGLLALAGVMVTTSHAREQAAVKWEGLRAAETTMEQIRGTDPSTIAAVYDGRSQNIYCVGLEGCDYVTVTTDVDTSVAGLYSVNVNTSWNAGGLTESFTCETQVYSSD